MVRAKGRPLVARVDDGYPFRSREIDAMNWIKRLFGRSETLAAEEVRTSGDQPAAAPERLPTNARDWLLEASGRDFVWLDLGGLNLPLRSFFVGDPTGGHDDHMRATGTVETDLLRIWVLESGEEGPEFEAHTNTLVWLEASGRTPTARGLSLDFGVDAACLALGSVEAGDAFTRLSDYEYEAGRGDSFDWILPFLHERPHFARWVEIPPDCDRMFIASTGNDGGFAAVQLHDADDELSGILIDIGGRAGDGLFLDKLLPHRST